MVDLCKGKCEGHCPRSYFVCLRSPSCYGQQTLPVRTSRYPKLHKAKFAENVLRMAFFLDGISNNKKSVLFIFSPVGTKKYLKKASGQRMLLQLSKLSMF